MAYDEHKRKLDSLLFFIRTRSAVTTRALAQKLFVSQRTVFRMISSLRLEGKDITYCDKKKEYSYNENGDQEK
jgi:predicted DNA-binding transcriptional regulator YafY